MNNKSLNYEMNLVDRTNSIEDRANNNITNINNDGFMTELIINQ